MRTDLLGTSLLETWLLEAIAQVAQC